MKQETDRKVLELLAREHVLSAGDAAERLGVSGASVRRSFRRLAELGEVRRVHGGIEELNRRMDPAYPFFLRMLGFTREKEALARRAISLLQGCRTIQANKNVHRPTLMRQVRAASGMSPQVYLIECRMQKALELRSNSSASIKEIAESAGFANANYFTKEFHRMFGRSPSELRALTLRSSVG